ncbi:MAG: amino acid adenylation domain-containing protein [Melioribacteraceae bacterium]|nr:amino acid adenylation domain-containing protein [Melioribacteraceae bacterium]MCF8262893.1 amino acid adenylation domain-containing protein [Melioribacteraceae bacterium]MCF8430915.1 amino acid adenylation domain-containing protein [Melioribacteraceae bacterium]
MNDIDRKIDTQTNSVSFINPLEKCVTEIFEDCVKKFPDKIALSFLDQNLSYNELNKEVNRLARYLIKNGIKEGEIVGVYFEKSFELIISILAILKTGAAYLPLDLRYPPNRISYMINNSGASLIISNIAHRQSLSKIDVKICYLDSDKKEIDLESDANINNSFSSENLAYVMYTSGTTGKPNGVEIPHRGIVRLVIETDYFPFSENHVFLQLAPTSFDASTFEIWGALLNGAKCVLYPGRVPEFDVLKSTIKTNNITCLWLTSSLFNLLIDEDPEVIKTVRFIITGGEALSVKHIKKAQVLLTNSQLINGYGPTENTTFTCCYQIPDIRNIEVNSIPIGKAINNTIVYILDENGNEAKEGELYIGGKGVALGYRNNPELTNQKFSFRRNPNNENERLYKTGDRVKLLPDGNIDFIGRVDNQVKIRGFRIELEEIETMLSDLKNIKQAAVIVRENDSGAKSIAAYLVVNETQLYSEENLRKSLSESLPEYMIPESFTVLQKMPLTPNGKLDRDILPDPSQKVSVISEEYEAPNSETELQLCEIWKNVLGKSTISRNDNFFNLGGNSLQATQLASRIRQHFRCEFSLKYIFQVPKLDKLATKIDSILQTTKRSSVIIPQAPDGALIPISFTQERMWFIEKLNPTSRAYQTQAKIDFKGTLNFDALEKSLNALVQRHEILRTTFPEIDGKPCQVVHEYKPFSLEKASLQKGENIENLMNDFFAIPFNLSELPLIRWKLIEIEKNEFTLFQVEHHFVHDGWSFNILMKEMFDFYKHFDSGVEVSLPELPIQFKDFAYWQRKWMSGEVLENQLNYWKTRLKGANPVLRLPLDFARPAQQTFNGKIIRLELPAELCGKLENFSKKEGVTLFLTMFAAYGILMHRYSGQDDIAIGSAIANRRWKETEGILGTFVNNVVFRLDLSKNLSTRELFAQLKKHSLDAFDNQDVPFDKVVTAVQPIRDQSINPIFQSAFAFHDSPMESLELTDLEVKITEAISNGSSKFDLNVIAVPRFQKSAGDSKEKQFSGITLLWEYNIALFKEPTMQKMIEHFQNVLDEIVKNPDNQIDEIPYLNESEINEQIEKFNNTIVRYPENETILDLFEQQVLKNPNSTAVKFGNKILSYSELKSKSNQVANYLVEKKKIKSGELAGVYGNRSDLLMINIMGILKSGAAYLPIDPINPTSRIDFMLKESKIRILFCDDEYKADLKSRFPQIDIIGFDDFSDEDLSDKQPDVHPGSDSLAYVIYTSGSTGLPKGVKIPHQGLYNHIMWAKKIYIQDDKANFPLHSSISFDITITSLFAPICSGGTVVIYGNEDIGTITEKIIEDNLVDVIKLTPAHIQFLPIDKLGKSKIRKVIVGGDEFKVDLAEKIHSAFNGNVDVFNSYGPTETVAGCLLHKYDSTFNYQTSLPIGLPVENRQIYILDNNLKPVPFNVEGEIYISGAGISTGYLNDSEITKEKFVDNPFNNESKLYKSGDYGKRLSDGQIIFSGRKDGQVKVRGYRIELGEIESVLQSFEKIKECVVLALDDIYKTKRLIAYCVFYSGENPSNSELKVFLKKKLPEYMIPAQFIEIESIPLTANGKIDSKSLPNPDFDSPESETHYKEPTTREELQLAEIWQKVLKVDKIGLDSNYFDLGGHSLLAVELMNSINKSLKKKLPLSAVFQAPTIRDLNGFIKEFEKEQSRVIPIQTKGENIPLICISPHESVHFFYVISKFLGDEYPVYGFESRMELLDSSKEKTIEEIASEYIEELLKLRPKGPYLLLGYSVSGIIVFEMVKQLRKLGINDVRLLILDTVSLDINYNEFNRKSALVKSIFYTWEKINKRLYYYKLRINSEGIRTVLIGKIRNLFNGSKNHDEQVEAIDNFFADVTVLDIHRAAAEKYVPVKTKVDIEYFQATDRFISPIEKYFAFHPFIDGKFTIHQIPGDHNTVHKDDGGKLIAEKLKLIIQNRQF